MPIKTRLGVSVCSAVAVLVMSSASPAGNPILPGLGVCDPDIRVYNGRAYLYASHDADVTNKTWRMDDWWVWSSDDLVNWRQESVLKPEQTYWRKPSDTCWATTAATRDGKYYFYFSRGRDATGVVVGDSPFGPWHDPIGKPLVSPASTPTKTAARDPAILQETDGNDYIVFGKFDFYVAKLNRDMVSLAESPRLIKLDRKFGPMGEGKTDDKPFLHRRGDKYYLSWGCFYAMADNPYGPFTYKGSVIDAAHTEPAFRKVLQVDRHGSFFEFNGQSYFTCNDENSSGATHYFRNSVISYVRYRQNGEIAPVRLDAQGVGSYDVAKGPVEAEDFFTADGPTPDAAKPTVRESADGFEVAGLGSGGGLGFPRVANLPADATLEFRIAAAGPGTTITVHAGRNGPVIGRCDVAATSGVTDFRTTACPLKNPAGTTDLYFVVITNGADVRLDRWSVRGATPTTTPTTQLGQ